MSPTQLYVINTGLMAIPLLQYKGLNALTKVEIGLTFTHFQLYIVYLV